MGQLIKILLQGKVGDGETQQDGSAKPDNGEFNPQDPHKSGGRESAPTGCPLTSAYKLRKATKVNKCKKKKGGESEAQKGKVAGSPSSYVVRWELGQPIGRAFA